ncbi:Uncharacterised protein [Bordetella ansorpii]|uniref:Uncharacterized protein n=1 Tax=Bordetella ansorpii TaxID=288768 RepID=A0A157R869_9BORD|nr:hypothetical protein [Bordetella ansorpii]SAI54148.1 Uncharacterised protein [Bordetella ansorpii]
MRVDVTEQIRIYDEVLNDLQDYFLLADLQTVQDFKNRHAIGDDMLTPMVTTELGDRIVEEGALLPLPGIANHPYTVIFNRSGKPVLEAAQNRIVHRQAGYLLDVTSERIFLFTIPYLRHWDSGLPHLKDHRPSFALPNGMYGVEVLAGYALIDGDEETVIEFVIGPADGGFHADFNYRYELE